MIGRVNQFLPEYLKRQELRREYESPTFDGINTEALIKNPQLRVVVLAILGLFLSGCMDNTTTSRDLAQTLKAPSGTISNKGEVGNFVQANPNNESATNIQREGENHMTRTAPHILAKGDDMYEINGDSVVVSNPHTKESHITTKENYEKAKALKDSTSLTRKEALKIIKKDTSDNTTASLTKNPDN